MPIASRFLEDLPLIGCGYIVHPDYMREIFCGTDGIETETKNETKNDTETGASTTGNPLDFDRAAMAEKVARWHFTLPPELRAVTPRIYIRNNKSDSDSDSDDDEKTIDYTNVQDFFILTRTVRIWNFRLVMDVRQESEKDRVRLQRFIDVFGRGIERSKLEYGITEVDQWVRYPDT